MNEVSQDVWTYECTNEQMNAASPRVDPPGGSTEKIGLDLFPILLEEYHQSYTHCYCHFNSKGEGCSQWTKSPHRL